MSAPLLSPLATDRLLNLLAPRQRRPRPDPEGQPPTDAELATLVQAAASVPDHGGLRPWRFLAISGGARRRFGDALATDVTTARPDAPPELVDRARRKAFAAPMIIVVVASPQSGSKVPEWEQTVSAACCGYAIVLAASALGLGAVWKSTPMRDGADLRRFCELRDDEQVLGWINVGARKAHETVEVKPAVDIAELVTVATH